MRVSVLHEAHDVSPDPADDLDEATGLPLLQRDLPGQVEGIRVDSARDEVDSHTARVPDAERLRHGEL